MGRGLFGVGDLLTRGKFILFLGSEARERESPLSLGIAIIPTMRTIRMMMTGNRPLIMSSELLDGFIYLNMAEFLLNCNFWD